MKEYTYQLPLTKGNTNQIIIFDETNTSQYYFKRIYKSFFHQIFDSWIGNFQLLAEYQGYDLKGNIVARAYKKHYLLKRSETLLRLDNGALFTAKMDGFDVITPTYHIKGKDLHLITKIDMKRFVQFYEDKHVVASIQLYFKPSKKSELQVLKRATIQNPLFYILYAQMFYFLGEY